MNHWRRLRRNAFGALGGAAPWMPLASFVLGIFALSATSGLGALLKSLLGAYDWVIYPVGIMASILAFLIAQRISRKKMHHVVDAKDAPAVECLVLFLSKPNGVPAARPEGQDITNPAFRASLGNWRMPAEAIAHHLGRLRLVVVIPSVATAGDVAQFRELMAVKATPQRPAPAVRSCAEVLGEADLASGLDYDDLEKIMKTLDDLYRALGDRDKLTQAGLLAKGGQPGILRGRLRESEILLDITSGFRLVAAGAVAHAVLVPERRFQYVHTERQYHVGSYDITWEPKA